MVRRALLTLGGGVVGWFGAWLAGYFVMRWLMTSASVGTGWEDLTAAAASLVTFAPLGAVVGVVAALGVRPAVRTPHWLVVALLAVVAGVVWTVVEGVAVACWGLGVVLVSGAVRGRRAARRPPRGLAAPGAPDTTR